ncbi:MAG: hypothetical protein IKX91_01765, partial [Firmicutes bacterium]|nr:hypothetical protein [Bacillota bacterium]
MNPATPPRTAADPDTATAPERRVSAIPPRGVPSDTAVFTESLCLPTKTNAKRSSDASVPAAQTKRTFVAADATEPKDLTVSSYPWSKSDTLVISGNVSRIRVTAYSALAFSSETV